MAKKKQQKKKVDLFHGGVPGLSRGSELLPAAKLPSGLPLSYENRFLYENAQPELIYLTADPLVARSYAARWVGRAEEGEGGSIYKVETRGPLTPDSDYSNDPGICWCARIAFVTEVLEVNVPLTEETALPAFRLMWWSDDLERMYSSDGYAQPSAPAKIAGVTATDLRPLGRLPNPRAVVLRNDELAQQALRDHNRAQAVLAWTLRHRPEEAAVVRQAIARARRFSGDGEVHKS